MPELIGDGTNGGAIANYSNVFIYGLGLEYFAKYPGQLRAVTARQVFDAAKKYVTPERMVVVAIGDAAQIEPELKKLNVAPVEVRSADTVSR